MPPVHPLGTRAKILLSSVFGPYAQNDEFGSRAINPMELYQNQVTRVQGAFSLRMFHRSFGLLMIQANIDAPCTLLDFPKLDRFEEEIRNNSYDIIGISGIIPNIGKVQKMCEIIRKHQPRATIVIGGHVANTPDIHNIVKADHIVRGDGIRWFRSFLGQNPEKPVKHPMVESAFGARILGHGLPDKPGDTAAILIPSVGCPVGCNFCSTSALFGGKGNFINFFETGDDLFQVMTQMEKEMKVKSFFILDENFLLHRKRALRLLELMQEHHKAWALSVFSSARVIKSYTMEQLAGLGICWVWMGVEGKNSQYRKLQDIDTFELVKELQSHGIRVLGSSIIGLETHTPENINDVIDYAVSHNTVFHQFMLYTPNPGTPLYEQHQADGTLLSESEFPRADAHGQYRFNYRHKHFKNGEEEQILISAFQKDFEQNGPSLLRLFETMFNGWLKYKNHPEARIRDRVRWETAPLRLSYAGGLWAMRDWYRNNEVMYRKADRLLKDICKEFGILTRLAAPIIGKVICYKLRREDQRLAQGWQYEPKCFYEKNEAARRLEMSQPEAKSKELKSGQIICEPSAVR